MSTFVNPPYDVRYLDALAWAAELHADQPRKGTEVPYISHLLRVSATIWEYGGDDTQAIAGLLHDAAEDQGGRGILDEIAKRYDPEVADIVTACSDSLVDTTAGADKADWLARKTDHIEHLKDLEPRTALVVAADKLDNLESIVRDIDACGYAEVMGRFNAGAADQVWFYGAVADAVRATVPDAMMRRFDAARQTLSNQVALAEEP
jgi:(p)ppGpp synthase/HD superfamily hydrolase